MPSFTLPSEKQLPLFCIEHTPPLQGFLHFHSFSPPLFSLPFSFLCVVERASFWPLSLNVVIMSWVMLVLAIGLLILAMTGHSSATWCVCKDGLGDPALQKTLDYACGAGADCTTIHPNGGCFRPNTVKDHCSFAANSYFQRKGQAPGSCDFSGTAMVTNIDPSISGCVYPSSASSVNSGTIPVSGTPTTTNPGTGLTPTTNTPFGSTTPTGVLGGNGFVNGNNGPGPSGVGGMNTDYTDSGSRLQLTLIANVVAFLFTLLLCGHMA